MNILIVQTYHYFRGGDATYGFSLAELLRTNGHEISFFGMKHPNNLFHENEKYFVDYIDFREANSNKNLSNSVKVLTRSIYSTQARKKFSQILDDKKPDIIHIQNLHGHITPSILFEAKTKNIPIVMTLHDYKFICPNTHLLSHGRICEKCEGGKYYNCLINKCKKGSIPASFIASLEAYIHKYLKISHLIDNYISPSIFLKNKFIQHGWNGKRISVINNFLPDNVYDDNSALSDDYILYFGQLEIWKGLNTLLNAAKELQQYKFRIVGEGTLKEKLLERCETESIYNVELLGYKSGDELKTIIKNCKLVVVPSEWYENYPYSIMEAMAFGKPIIAAKIGGIPELVNNDENGLLFISKDYRDLKNKFIQMCKNDDLRVNLGKNSFRIANEKFRSLSHLKEIEKVYNLITSTK